VTNMTHRDHAFREQPSLFDGPAVAAPVIADQGKQSRNENYRAVKGDHQHERMKWLSRIVIKGRYGATLDELSAEYGVSANTFSGRFTELAGLGLVVRTGERRATRSGSSASVIVAIDFLRSEKPTATTEATSVIAPKEYMPGQLTNVRTPHDHKGDMVRADRCYLVSMRGRGKSVRLRVFEDNGDLYCQEITANGSPVVGSRPQRIDEMDSAVSWRLL
jgi:hypothetical protein